jgi:hypothetical protein
VRGTAAAGEKAAREEQHRDLDPYPLSALANTVSPPDLSPSLLSGVVAVDSGVAEWRDQAGGALPYIAPRRKTLG